MCDKAMYRSGNEGEIPKPRTAEELRKAAKELEKKREGIYATLQRDYMR